MDILTEIIAKLKAGKSIKAISEELRINRHSISLVKRMLDIVDEKERKISSLSDEIGSLKNQLANTQKQLKKVEKQLEECKQTRDYLVIVAGGLIALLVGFLIGKIIHILGG